MHRVLTAARNGVVLSLLLLPVACGIAHERFSSSDAGVFDARTDEAVDAFVADDPSVDVVAAPDAFECGARCAPRPIAPLSSATVTAHQPTLRWELGLESDGVRVEICRDRAMTTECVVFDAVGDSSRPPSALAPGLWFWRLQSTWAGIRRPFVGPTWQMIVRSRELGTDTSWGAMLDTNGDGYADVAVGSPGESEATGAVYVYLGSEAGVDPSPRTILHGTDGARAGFGGSVAVAGDVNGDGYGDLIVTAEAADDAAGRVYVYFGTPTGVVEEPTAVLLGDDGAGSLFGHSAAGVGDLNGDGYGDIAVGALRAGHVYIYLGGETLPSDAQFVLSSPDGAANERVRTVASGADVNGDGFGDLIVGASSDTSSAGVVRVYTGAADGLHLSESRTLRAPDGPGDAFGTSVASDDLDGDGYPEVAVGAYDFNGHMGRVYVFEGTRDGGVAAPSVVLSDLEPSDTNFGFRLATMNDFDGDGYGELVVSADTNDAIGCAYLFAGSAEGIAPDRRRSVLGPDGANGRFGTGLAAAGDVNRDGYFDLVVGAYGHDAQTGRAYVYPGNASGTLLPTVVLSGSGPAARFGSSVACVWPRHRAAEGPS